VEKELLVSRRFEAMFRSQTAPVRRVPFTPAAVFHESASRTGAPARELAVGDFELLRVESR
jgi:hypothetical protein